MTRAEWIGATSRTRAWLPWVGGILALALALGAFAGWTQWQGYSWTVGRNVLLGRLGIFRFAEPEMVRIPPGNPNPQQLAAALTFQMGSDAPGALAQVQPVHTVHIAKPYLIGKYPVTFDQYDVFVALINREGGCLRNPGLPDGGKYIVEKPADDKWGRATRPVVNVNWNDATCYVRWLSEKTGKAYRLPSEAEWEHAARAGTTTTYWWGDDVQQDGKVWANCMGCGSEWDHRQTAPVGSFPPNPFGLFDMAGNVWQWVQDCHHENYAGAPTDGTAWVDLPKCQTGRRVLRGGSWNFKPHGLKSESRNSTQANAKYDYVGFRIAGDAAP